MHNPAPRPSHLARAQTPTGNGLCLVEIMFQTHDTVFTLSTSIVRHIKLGIYNNYHANSNRDSFEHCDVLLGDALPSLPCDLRRFNIVHYQFMDDYVMLDSSWLSASKCLAKAAKNWPASFFDVESISRAPSWAILPVTAAVTS